MWRDRVWIAMITAAVVAAAVFGAVKRESYTDIVREPGFMERAMVAEFGEQIAAVSCEQMEQSLPEAPVILRVSPAGEQEYFFRGGRQKVTVRQIYKGDEVEIGEEFYVTSVKWCVLPEEGSVTVQSGFVNRMREGQDYLVFLDAPFEGLEGEKIYPFYEENFIAPMFCYEDRDNIVIPVEEVPTIVPYSAVKDNEFFAYSEEGLQIMLGLKHRMFAWCNRPVAEK